MGIYDLELAETFATILQSVNFFFILAKNTLMADVQSKAVYTEKCIIMIKRML